MEMSSVCLVFSGAISLKVFGGERVQAEREIDGDVENHSKALKCRDHNEFHKFRRLSPP